MRSPIFDLNDDIAGCAFRVALERAPELARLRDLQRIVVEAVDERGFRIRVDPTTGHVKVTVAALEFLWACAYLLFVIYQENVKAQTAGQSTFR